jgi:hypothetical protein
MYNKSKWIFISLIALLFSTEISAQKAYIVISKNDTSPANISQWDFGVIIKNNKLKKYRVQDTAIIKKRIDYPYSNLITPYLEIRSGKRYVQYEDKLPQGVSLPTTDSCFFSCCNCIDLKKGEFLKINLKLLQPFELAPGKYRMHVALTSPAYDCKECKLKEQIFSNYLYFEVN